MDYDKIYEDVSRETGFPVDTVRLAYRTFWRFIRTKIEEMPLKDIDPDALDSLRTSFNIPSIGKLVCRKDRFRVMKNNYKNYIENGRSDIKEDGHSCVQQDSDDS